MYSSHNRGVIYMYAIVSLISSFFTDSLVETTAFLSFFLSFFLYLFIFLSFLFSSIMLLFSAPLKQYVSHTFIIRVKIKTISVVRHIYIHTHIYTYIYTYTHTHTHIYIYIHAHIPIPYTFMQAHVYSLVNLRNQTADYKKDDGIAV
jgi:hypothetical protein